MLNENLIDNFPMCVSMDWEFSDYYNRKDGYFIITINIFNIQFHFLFSIYFFLMNYNGISNRVW